MVKFKVEINNRRNVWLNGERLHRKYGTGSNRKIYLGENFIVKVEWFENHMNQCKDEVKIWKALPSEYKKYFLPILKFGHEELFDYIVCPRLDLEYSVDEKDIVWDTKLRKIARQYKLLDVYGRLNDNWWIIKGQPIITDYGV